MLPWTLTFVNYRFHCLFLTTFESCNNYKCLNSQRYIPVWTQHTHNLLRHMQYCPHDVQCVTNTETNGTLSIVIWYIICFQALQFVGMNACTDSMVVCFTEFKPVWHFMTKERRYTPTDLKASLFCFFFKEKLCCD